ncbi:MAG: diguanylate cyclase [Gammaproteobacteria bacterium]|jgi:diguanylate cyclase (GGDEF)-like protein|nr:diguanylate cyclase [Gammaproteobacteria bacterium]
MSIRLLPRYSEPEPGDRRIRARDPHWHPERRVDLEGRKRVAQMSPEEMQRTLLTHELTGIRNRRAWEEAERLPAVASIDADSLKWFNDAMGHEAGDRALREIANTLARVTREAYHLSGDEFLIQGHAEDEVRRVVLRARRLLHRVVIETKLPDGSTLRKIGLEISYGIGASRTEAEARLVVAKAAREASGARAARGEAPRRGVIRLGSDNGRDMSPPQARRQPGLRRWLRG